MQPPLPLGTVLQNRYCLIKILGQGGFGRTYLAQDQGRFKELCALKELIPLQSDDYVWEKSKELFQREATILYQIQHPQVPQFRATFEQDQRLFLVQDYVEGKTYQTLLDERIARGQAFSEVEVLQLMQQLLPVLAHLHTRGIIHRDIAPDNIICRASDGKPVLIDFGVVKELATRLQSNNTTKPTTVGKLGYAPAEQIQTGKAYPSSDLYALAVTAIVLLTGRQPPELFDDTQMAWNWQSLVRVNAEFAQVLNRMLRYNPSDRYPRVVDVAKALATLNDQLSAAPLSPAQLPEIARQSVAMQESQVRTIPVGRRQLNATNHPPNSLPPVIAAPKSRDFLDNPWAIAASGVCVALIAGFGTLMVVSSILNNQPTPQSFPSPVISQTPTPLPSAEPATPSSEPINYNQRLEFVGENATVTGSLKTNETIDYAFSGTQGQQLTATLAPEGTLLSVLGANQRAIDDTARRVTRYQGTLPYTGEYSIRLRPVQGVNESTYQLDVRLETPVAPSPLPEVEQPTSSSETPAATVVPTVETERITFNAGETATQVVGQTNRQQIRRYLVNVEQGQVLSATVAGDAVSLSIRYPNGEPVEQATDLLNWQAQATRSGEYQIDVVTDLDQDTAFNLDVSVSNLQ